MRANVCMVLFDAREQLLVPMVLMKKIVHHVPKTHSIASMAKSVCPDPGCVMRLTTEVTVVMRRSATIIGTPVPCPILITLLNSDVSPGNACP